MPSPVFLNIVVVYVALPLQTRNGTYSKNAIISCAIQK